MKFPKIIKICNQTWNIEFCNINEKLAELHDKKVEDLVDDGETVLGFCASQLRLICIEKNMEPSVQLETLIHEIGHAYHSVQPHNWGTEHDEQFARMFASCVIDLYLNNDIRWLKTN